MRGYDASTYGERIAGVYDDWYAAVDAAMVDRLAELAGGGRALELGIGTGRVAIPLAERGVRVEGVDASPEMVGRLRQRPGGAEIPVALGDFTAAPVTGKFGLVYVVFNTFFALLTQEAQVECMRSVAGRLEPGGVFVVEAFVPDLTRFSYGQSLMTMKVDAESVVVDACRHDLAAQTVTGQHVLLSEAGTRLFPVCLRYAWPAEMDLMARLAGMRLRERWADWSRSPFGAESGKHISIYELAA